MANSYALFESGEPSVLSSVCLECSRSRKRRTRLGADFRFATRPVLGLSFPLRASSNGLRFGQVYPEFDADRSGGHNRGPARPTRPGLSADPAGPDIVGLSAAGVAYGYRPKRSAQDAIRKVHRLICEGYTDVGGVRRW